MDLLAQRKTATKNVKGGIDRIVAIALVAAALAGCGRKPAEPASREYRWPVMGTFGSLVVNGEDGDAAMAIARDAVEEVNAALSAFNPTSDVSRVNAKAGSGEFTQTGLHFQTMMAASRQCHDASGGAFNPAVGPLMETWGFFRGGAAHEFPPSEAAIAQALPLCDFAQAEMRPDGAARLNREGMRLDFGAIAKGYAVDVAFERLAAAWRWRPRATTSSSSNWTADATPTSWTPARAGPWPAWRR